MDRFILITAAVFLFAGATLADTNTTPAGAGSDEEAWPQHVIESFKLIQDKQVSTERAIQQARDEAISNANRSTAAIEARIKDLEQVVADQHAHDIDSLTKSHRSTLLIVGAGGLVVVILFGLIVLRAMNRRPATVTVQPLGETVPFSQLGTGAGGLASLDPARQGGQRLRSSLDRLEQRLNELETATDSPLTESPALAAQAGAATVNQKILDLSSRIALLLGKGQALMNLQQLGTALTVYDEIIALDPDNADAFVKKGAALEKMGRLDDAIVCYDQAIAVDKSMTMAYLCKGGVFNRLERYNEALQCYEEALRTDQNTVG